MPIHIPLSFTSYFCPRQLGAETKVGCEAAVRATHLSSSRLQPGHKIAKLDFRNALNCIYRDNVVGSHALNFRTVAIVI